jgi:3' terminal RNA ribose 2'-O-methyltransferase Hen1
VGFLSKNTPEKATVALFLEIDPLQARQSGDQRKNSQFAYVSVQPYSVNSFMTVALSRVFSSTMAGNCPNNPELARQKLDLAARIAGWPCPVNRQWLEEFFHPLGYQVQYDRVLLDPAFPDWGLSPYVNLNLRGRVTAQDLLRHLYVAIPVFDGQKRYWIDEAEVAKLERAGKGWLADHPMKNFIAARYLRRDRQLTNLALSRIERGDNWVLAVQDDSSPAEIKPSLNALRLAAVMSELTNSGVSSVLDVGRGQGRLLRRLSQENSLVKLAGLDVSSHNLKIARKVLTSSEGEADNPRVSVFHGSNTYLDPRLMGYEALVATEVIEHLEPGQLADFVENVFGVIRPKVVVLTTPNQAYNVNYPSLAGDFRRPDHRFEWDRARFQAWTRTLAEKYGYQPTFKELGELAETSDLGAPSQMGGFRRCARNP